MISKKIKASNLITVLILLLNLVGGASCGNPIDGHNSTPKSEKFLQGQRRSPAPRVANKSQSDQVVQDLQKMLNAYSESGSTSWPRKTLYFNPATPSDRSMGQRILILEDIALPQSSVLRYKNRVLDLLKLSKVIPGKYERVSSSLTVSQPTADVGDYLAGLPFHVPVSELIPVANTLKSIRANGTEYSDVSLNNIHAIDVFELLADLNPEAQFILAEIPTKLDPADFCHFYDPTVSKKIESLYAHAALSLFEIVEKYGINYINISWAPSRERIYSQFSQMCGPNSWDILNSHRAELNEFLSIEAEFYENLSYLKSVAIFKALPNDSRTRPDLRACRNSVMSISSDNYFNIGFFSTDSFWWGLEGGWDQRLLNSSQRNLSQCADAYLNGGFIESEAIDDDDDDENEGLKLGPEPLKLRSRGITYTQPKVMSTSMATPIALSMANHFILDGIFNSYPEFRKWLKQPSQPRMLDPLKFRKFELFASE